MSDTNFVRPDKIEVGDISGTGIAIGTGAQVIVQNIQRALSEIEIADQAVKRERRLLGESVIGYVGRLQDQARQAYKGNNPYKELLEYDLQDAALFFGRAEAKTAILNQMEHHRLIVLHSESGAGKTSLLKAGILPKLLADGHLPLHLRPNQNPIPLYIKRFLVTHLEEIPRLASASLKDFLREINDLLVGHRLVIMVDQFEEFFSTEIPDEERKEFIDQLALCLDEESLSVNWIFALRGESLSKLIEAFRPQIKLSFPNEYLLRKLTREEASQIILIPAQLNEIYYEPGLGKQILDDLGDEYVDPPQLQMVCYALIESLDGRKQITYEIYNQAGRTAGILKSHLDRELKRLPYELRPIAQRLLERLVTSDHRRDLLTKDSLAIELKFWNVNQESLNKVINQLETSRLIRVHEIVDDQRNTILAYELVHDYLLQEIVLDAEVKNRKAAEELIKRELENANRFPGTLIDSHKLDILAPHLNDIPLLPEARLLIEESKKARTKNRLLYFTGRLAAFFFVTLVISFIAWNLISRLAIPLQEVDMDSLLWILVIPFALLGASLGWERGILVTLSVTAALLIISLLDPLLRQAPSSVGTPYIINGVLIIFMTFLGYQASNFITLLSRTRLLDSLLGLIFGSVNGYLIVGSLVFYIFNYLSVVPIIEGSSDLDERILSLLPPVVLTPPLIYFAVAIAILFAVIIFI